MIYPQGIFGWAKHLLQTVRRNIGCICLAPRSRPITMTRNSMESDQLPRKHMIWRFLNLQWYVSVQITSSCYFLARAIWKLLLSPVINPDRHGGTWSIGDRHDDDKPRARRRGVARWNSGTCYHKQCEVISKWRITSKDLSSCRMTGERQSEPFSLGHVWSGEENWRPFGNSLQINWPGARSFSREVSNDYRRQTIL